MKKDNQRANQQSKKPANATINKRGIESAGTRKLSDAAANKLPQKKPSLIQRLFRKIKRPKKSKNVSQNIPNGTLIITNDKYFYGTDGKSNKTRMSTVVDSNRNDEIALVKYTTSKKHGRPFSNSKGFVGHADKIYTLDNNKKPIKVDNDKFIANPNRAITASQANEIKRRNLKESRYKEGNKANLRNLKKRRKKNK